MHFSPQGRRADSQLSLPRPVAGCHPPRPRSRGVCSLNGSSRSREACSDLAGADDLCRPRSEPLPREPVAPSLGEQRPSSLPRELHQL